MKNIKFLYLALIALVAGASTACQEDWTPGEPDSAQSVYLSIDEENAIFPVGENVAKYPVYRQVAGPEMAVEVRARMLDEVFEGTDVFTFADAVVFEEGETVAYLEITLREDLSLSVGEQYDAEILIKDPAYHGNYGLSRRVIKVGIPETWLDYGKDKDGKDKNPPYAVYYDDAITPLYGGAPAPIQVSMEESESRPGFFRLVNPYTAENVVNCIGGIPSEITFLGVDHYIQIDARDPEKVYIPASELGFIWGPTGKPAWLGTNGASDPKNCGKLEDDIITFPANTIIFIVDIDAGAGYYANTSGMLKVVMPGKILTDYSIGISHLGSQSNASNDTTQAVINFTLGKDVNKYRFAIVEGNHPIKTGETSGPTLGPVEVKYHDSIVNLLNDEYEPTEDDVMVESAASDTTWYCDFDKSGVYTVFAVPFDKAGVAQEDDIARMHFYYRAVNSEESVPVLADMEFELTTIAKLVPSVAENYPGEYFLGLNMANPEYDYIASMTMYFDDTENVDAALAAGETLESLIADDGDDDMYYGTNMDSWIKELADGGGYAVQIFQNLYPGTKYTVIYAVESIFGATAYYRVDGQTDAYSGNCAVGNYRIVEGENSLDIKLAPRVTGDDRMAVIMFTVPVAKLPEGVEIEDYDENDTYTFYGEYRPDLKAIVIQGQLEGFESYGGFFGKGLGYYSEDESQLWGYASSVDAKYSMIDDSLVILLEEQGDKLVPTRLYNYFKQYYYYMERTKDEETGEVTEELIEKDIISFTPEATIEFVSSIYPEQTEEETPEQDDEVVETTVRNVGSVKPCGEMVTLKVKPEILSGRIASLK